MQRKAAVAVEDRPVSILTDWGGFSRREIGHFGRRRVRSEREWFEKRVGTADIDRSLEVEEPLMVAMRANRLSTVTVGISG